MYRQTDMPQVLAALLLMVMVFGAESAFAQFEDTRPATITEASVFDNGLRVGASLN
ncbi:MAG: hypothetical protein LAT84_08925 [Balneolia bacterium]|nr:hypothetical protein [Balneolia bacterium]